MTDFLPANEIILYQPDESVHLEVIVGDETVWLTQAQMAELFSASKQSISRHINNIIKDGELQAGRTVKESLTVQIEGGRKVQRKVSYYNLDMIISVGYRVKSQRGIDFRIWATNVLKEYILRGYAITQRFERLENRVAEAEKQIGFFVRTTKTISGVHDRFLIVDNCVYHIGASVKDLGKRLFAFSKMSVPATEFLRRLGL
ncbi:MAG: virulence RhuM family protein [Clostridiales Family XIII bacterium]|jgi:hypothetical protein|nr:virulence RhuM family protein [Clostridiales Family XIII bacterium]